MKHNLDLSTIEVDPPELTEQELLDLKRQYGHPNLRHDWRIEIVVDMALEYLKIRKNNGPVA